MGYESFNIAARTPRLSAAPALLGSAVLAQNEAPAPADTGTQNATATITGVSSGGVCLVGIGAVITAQFASIALNNGNTFPAATVTEVYSPLFSDYSMNIWARSGASGGSDHAITLTKTAPFTAEGTVALIAVASGSVTASSSVVRNAAGAGATLTSAAFTVPAGKRARCIAIDSGSGNVNATPPTATITDSATWGSPIIAIARGTATAPSGHIPLHVWVADLPPGTYTWSAVHTIDEGAIMATIVCQV